MQEQPRILRVKNFVTSSEISEINNWVQSKVDTNMFSPGISPGFSLWSYNKRLTTRSQTAYIKHPPILLSLSEKVRKFVGVSEYPLIEGHGSDGIVISYTKFGGDVYEHVDPRCFNTNMLTLRCNIMTQASQGCDLYIAGEKIDIEVGELHCYLVSEHMHRVSKSTSETPRIMLMFGAHVPEGFWE